MGLCSSHRSADKPEIEEEKAVNFTDSKMISLVLVRSPMSMATIIFFTCVWIPLRQLKKAIGGLISGRACPPATMEAPPCVTKLPVCGFEECGGGVEEICSICLVEFAGEDLVSQLPKCRHFFHFECIENWLDRNHFSCPLCRSLLFNLL